MYLESMSGSWDYSEAAWDAVAQEYQGIGRAGSAGGSATSCQVNWGSKKDRSSLYGGVEGEGNEELEPRGVPIAERRANLVHWLVSPREETYYVHTGPSERERVGSRRAYDECTPHLMMDYREDESVRGVQREDDAAKAPPLWLQEPASPSRELFTNEKPVKRELYREEPLGEIMQAELDEGDEGGERFAWRVGDMPSMPQEDIPGTPSDDDASHEASSGVISPPSVIEEDPVAPPSAYLQALLPASSVARGPLCTVCREPVRIEAAVRLQCGHTYDTSCIKMMYQRASVEESVYPPRCCKDPIPFSDVQAHLGPILAAAFQGKEKEYRTANRVYCHNPTCSTFLRGYSTLPTPTPCPKCKLFTCARCKQRGHSGYECHQDSKDESVLSLGRENGWRRCPSCQHLIEVDEGCYHVTCRCGKEFCYKCGVVWKGCKCDLFYVPPEDVVEAPGIVAGVAREVHITRPHRIVHGPVRQL
ncbi:hypothetical protein C8Q73DRAFT_100763 [Cubamyces lactineus]|nr:hypothetical protein C8Q73DRAFT_100763 [Cubamyces lactineus]